MQNDDRPVGRLLTRRQVLALLGSAGAVWLAGGASVLPRALGPDRAFAQSPSVTPLPLVNATIPATHAVAGTSLPLCVARPAMTQGPYFVDEMLNRSDIRSDPVEGTIKQGAPLTLTVRVSQVNGSACAPLAGMQVDVWHCDALGVYSDVADPGFDSRGTKFLRGYQLTDANGIARFTTLYPGWYQGRAVHIHFKIRTHPQMGAGREFTSQWFFDDTLTDQVHDRPPYSTKGQRTIRNERDGIYRSGGSQLVLDVTPQNGGYAATFDIGLT